MPCMAVGPRRLRVSPCRTRSSRWSRRARRTPQPGGQRMLTITVPGQEVYDESTGLLSTVNDVHLELEHSLVSLSKWEQIFEKSFIGTETKTNDELFAYMQCMVTTPDYPAEVWLRLSEENVEKINDYISAKMTATTFLDPPGAPKTREVITAELIYYWMTVFNIPFECQHWHLNRLFTLIRVCNVKQSKPKKMSSAEASRQRAELNAQRRAKYGTSG